MWTFLKKKKRIIDAKEIDREVDRGLISGTEKTPIFTHHKTLYEKLLEAQSLHSASTQTVEMIICENKPNLVDIR